MHAASLESADQLEFIGFGWRYYNSIKNKAMEREFSWSGLLVSLSIAFFVIIAVSLAMSLFCKSVTEAEQLRSASVTPMYQNIKEIPSQRFLYLNGQAQPRLERLNLG